MAGEVVVVGSANVDLVARVRALPAPGETIAAAGEVAVGQGGKGANQAVAAARAGIPTRLLARLGDDAWADVMLGSLVDAGVDVSSVERLVGVATSAALVTVDGDGQNTVVVGDGANQHLLPAAVAGLVLGPADVVVTQLEVPTATTVAALVAGRAAGATTICNLAPFGDVPTELSAAVDVLVVNEVELGQACGGGPVDPADDAAVEAAARSLATPTVVVTLGALGVLAVAGEDVHRLAAPPVDAVDATGAGDCFVGSLAARLAAGDDLIEALACAVAASALSVQRPGAGPSMPTAAEVAAAR